MKKALSFINQINTCRKVHGELKRNFEADIELVKKQDVDSSYFYSKNEPQYYVLLRCLHEFEDYLIKQDKVLTVTEKTYFYNLYRYGRSLLKVIKFFPRLTYFFWQKSIGAYREPFYEQVFFKDRKSYALLEHESSNLFSKLKMSC